MEEPKNRPDQGDGKAKSPEALDGRYRKIGISAVAAAVRYQGSCKNAAYAPAPDGADAYTHAATDSAA
jgi:hypothetical protein